MVPKAATHACMPTIVWTRAERSSHGPIAYFNHLFQPVHPLKERKSDVAFDAVAFSSAEDATNEQVAHAGLTLWSLAFKV